MKLDYAAREPGDRVVARRDPGLVAAVILFNLLPPVLAVGAVWCEPTLSVFRGLVVYAGATAFVAFVLNIRWLLGYDLLSIAVGALATFVNGLIVFAMIGVVVFSRAL